MDYATKMLLGRIASALEQIAMQLARANQKIS